LRASIKLLVPALALVTTSCGSGSSLYPVEGTVTFQDRPAVGALVVFFPEADSSVNAVVPSGTVGDDGRFTLNTNGAPGAPAGKYKVVVQIPVSAAAAPQVKGLGGGEERQQARYVAGLFAARATTPLAAEVKTGSTTIDPIKLP
jgi:hypothetical protein